MRVTGSALMHYRITLLESGYPDKGLRIFGIKLTGFAFGKGSLQHFAIQGGDSNSVLNTRPNTKLLFQIPNQIMNLRVTMLYCICQVNTLKK